MSLSSEHPSQTDGTVVHSAESGHSWFSYDPNDGFEIHDTEAHARKRAEDILQFYRDEAAEGWDEEVTQVCWGKIMQKVEQKWLKQKPPASEIDEDGYDAEGNNWSQFDELADYHLTPHSTSSPPPAPSPSIPPP